MPEWQQRVIAEKAELDYRLDGLRKFLPSDVCLNLPFDERCSLQRQQVLMAQLSIVLGERIEAFRGHA